MELMSFMAAAAIGLGSAFLIRAETKREHISLRFDINRIQRRLGHVLETTSRWRRSHPVKSTSGDSLMADNSTTTIRATFETREAADLAVEHLVQQHGVSRPDIFVQPAGDRNTAGAAPSGGDASHDGGSRRDAPLEGEIEVSADIAVNQVAAVERSLGNVGALHVSSR
jgi:hypothetical protein